MVHVSASRRCEIVVFGRDQKLLTPVVLGNGGSILLNAADGDPRVQISKIIPSRLDQADRKISSPLALGEVIRETAQLGATYPEIVAILAAAFQQKNLPGPLVVDAVPSVRPEVDAAVLFGIDTTSAKKDEAVQKTSGAEPIRKNFFDRFRRGSSR